VTVIGSTSSGGATPLKAESSTSLLLPLPAVIGIVVGAFVCIVLSVAGLVFLIYWKRQGLRRKPTVKEDEVEEVDMETTKVEESSSTTDEPKEHKKKKKKKKKKVDAEGEANEEGERWGKLQEIVNA
jgi:cell division protein FtsL